MKKLLLFLCFALFQISFGQSIWTNPITGSDPSIDNPFTTGDVKNANISVSGIRRSSSVDPDSQVDSYSTTLWRGAFDISRYYEFTLSPESGYKINFVNFNFNTAIIGAGGPTSFELRSNIDGFEYSIGSVVNGSNTISLSDSDFQNITSTITFRIYAWNADNNAVAFAIEDFTFNGAVLIDTATTQSIWSNEITDANPSGSNPYTNGDVSDPNITVSGISRGIGITPFSVANRYDASGWPNVNFNVNDYYEFTLTPNSSYKINLNSFVFDGQSSGSTGPTQFALQSSLDNYTSQITVVEDSNIIDLTNAIYQNITTPITFRLYAWSATNEFGRYGINSFTFNGTVDIDALVDESIWSNPIIDANPSASNPYISGDVKNANISVSGISRGIGIIARTTSNRYDATAWNSPAFDANDYFEFTLTPNSGYKIDLNSFVFDGQVASASAPTNFSLRSSLDGYVTSIGVVQEDSNTIDLTNTIYQNLTSSITFRLYAWGATASDGRYGINSFQFKGNVVASSCVTPTISTTGIIDSVCFNPSSTTTVILPYTATTGNPVGYSIDWNVAATSAGLIDQSNSSQIFNSGSGNVNIVIAANIPVGTYEGVITIGTGSCIVSQVVSLTVLTNTSSAGSASPTVCLNNPLTNITHTTTGATGIGTATGLPAGVTAAFASDTITISGTPTESGTFNYSIPLTGGCGSIDATGTIIVSPNVTPLFSPLTNLCLGESIPPLPVTSINGIVGTWSPALNNTATTTYTFAPNTGQCSTSATLTIIVRPAFTPGEIATSGEFICSGGDPTLIGSVTPASGGDSGIIYRWSSSTDGTNYSAIANTNSVTYDPPSGLTEKTWYQRQATDGSCNTDFNNPNNVSSGVWIVDFTTSVTVGSASSSPSVCFNAALTNITHATTGATGIGTATGLPTGVSASWASDTITISGTPTESGTFNYSIPLTGGCGSVIATGLITVLPDFIPGAIATTGETICIGGDPAEIGSITAASGGDGAITYEWYSSTNGLIYTSISGTNSVTYNPPTGLIEKTWYRRQAIDGTCSTNFNNPNNVATGRWIVDVTPNNTVGTASSSPTVCFNAAITNITHITTSATGIGTATGLPAGVTASWASDTITISGTPTESGTFNYSIPLTGGCGSVSATGLITVLPEFLAGSIPNSTIASPGEIICSGGDPSLIGSTTPASGGDGNITYRWSSSTDGFIYIPIANSNSETYDPPSGLTVTTRYLREAIDGTCNTSYTLPSSRSTGRWIVEVAPAPNVPTIGAITNAGCTETGSVVLNDLPSGTWLINQTGTQIAAFVGSGSSRTITGLSPGSYTFTITVGSCTSSETTPVIIAGPSVTIWTGSPTPSWDNGTPTSSMVAIISENYSEVGDITACSLTVNSNAVVTIPSGSNVTLNGAITVSSGSFTLENNANLVQVSNAINSGVINLKRNSNPLMRFDYIAWSSPVLNQGLLNFSPLTSISPTVRFYTFNSSTNLYTSVTNINSANFDSGIGYLIRMPFDHPTTPTIWTGTFTGQAFNGPKSVTLVNNISDPSKRFNLIGNPYPSTISIPAFAAANNGNIESTLYFWRKTNNAASPSYCSYNIVSGIYADNGEAFTENPNGVIQIGQGFLAQAKPGATTVVFDNNQRIVNNANQFFRNSSDVSTNSPSENNTIWLNMTGVPTEFSQAVIGYYDNASQSIDDYDSKYFNDGAIAFTSIVDNQDFVIQGRATFNSSDVVPMKYKVVNSGTYSIAIDHLDGIFSSGSQAVFVKDNLLNTYHNLNNGAYTFTSNAGTFTNRFEIVYQTALSNNDVDFTSNDVMVYNQNNVLHINSGNTSMDSVKVFDVRGRILIQKNGINSAEAQINVPKANQVFIVEITSIEGNIVIKKVLN